MIKYNAADSTRFVAAKASTLHNTTTSMADLAHKASGDMVAALEQLEGAVGTLKSMNAERLLEIVEARY